MEEKWIKEIESSQLTEPLSNTLKDFLHSFAALPPQPNAFNPFYMRLLLNMLVDDVCSDDRVDHLWWEMVLFLAKSWAADRGEDGNSVIEHIKHLSPLLAEHFNTEDSQVTLQEVTQKTLFGITMLSETLGEPKRNFVAPNVVSIAQAYFAEDAWFRAIYDW
jgi:hypothetical protein